MVGRRGMGGRGAFFPTAPTFLLILEICFIIVLNLYITYINEEGAGLKQRHFTCNITTDTARSGAGVLRFGKS